MTVEDRDILGIINGELLWGTHIQNLAKSSLSNGVIGDTVAGTSLKVVQPTTANMSVNVNAGKCLIDGVFYSESLATNLAISTGHVSYDRYDLIIYDQSAGNPAVTTGVAAANPFPPDVPDDKDIALAVVYVESGEDTSILSADIYDVRTFAGSVNPYCITYASGTLSFLDNTETSIKWDTDKSDLCGMHEVGTAYVYARVDGIYSFDARIQWTSIGTTGGTYLRVKDQSGTIWAESFYDIPQTNNFTIQVTGIAPLTSGHYLYCTAFQNGGATANINSTLSDSSFSVIRLGS